jgi:hypothetical protein
VAGYVDAYTLDPAGHELLGLHGLPRRPDVVLVEPGCLCVIVMAGLTVGASIIGPVPVMTIIGRAGFSRFTTWIGAQ